MIKSTIHCLAAFCAATTLGGGCASGDNGSTIVTSAVMKSLSNRELTWPSKGQVEVMAAVDSGYARYDSYRWQSQVLTEPFQAVPPEMRSHGVAELKRLFVAARSPAGFDAIYHQWDAGGYRFLFQSTAGMFHLAVVRLAWAGQPLAPSDGRLEQRLAEVLAALLPHGAELAAAAPWHRETLDGAVAFSVERTALPGGAPPPAWPAWLPRIRVVTDGASFVFDIPKLGDPAARPDVKSWFEPLRR